MGPMKPHPARTTSRSPLNFPGRASTPMSVQTAAILAAAACILLASEPAPALARPNAPAGDTKQRPPVVRRLVPPRGAMGDTIRLEGSGFIQENDVEFKPVRISGLLEWCLSNTFT